MTVKAQLGEGGWDPGTVTVTGSGCAGSRPSSWWPRPRLPFPSLHFAVLRRHKTRRRLHRAAVSHSVMGLLPVQRPRVCLVAGSREDSLTPVLGLVTVS